MGYGLGVLIPPESTKLQVETIRINRDERLKCFRKNVHGCLFMLECREWDQMSPRDALIPIAGPTLVYLSDGFCFSGAVSIMIMDASRWFLQWAAL